MELDKKLKPISRTTLADEIFEQFLELIINRELDPGDKLPTERELAEKLGVGRSSVREALRALSAIGLLEARPGDGTFVTKSPTLFFLSPFILRGHITKENLPDVIEARLLIEVKLASLAAERGSKDEKALIQQYFDKMVNTKDSRQHSMMSDQALRQEIVQEDWNFHQAIAQAANNPYLFQMFLMTRYLIQEWVLKPSSGYIYNYFGAAVPEHQEIVAAIQAADADSARRAMQKHLENAEIRLLKLL